FGALRVDLYGYLATSSHGQLGEARLTFATVQARWQDTLKLGNTINPEPGRLHHIKAKLILDGGIDVSVEGDAPFNTQRVASSTVRLKLLGNSPIGGDALPPPLVS